MALTGNLLLNRYNQSNLESQNRQSNASMLARASPPAAPSSPKVAANLLLGLCFGLAVGVGVALMLEQFDRRIRVPADAVAAQVARLWTPGEGGTGQRRCRLETSGDPQRLAQFASRWLGFDADVLPSPLAL